MGTYASLHTHVGTHMSPHGPAQNPPNSHAMCPHTLACEPSHKCTHKYMQLGDCGRVSRTAEGTLTPHQQHSVSGVDP